MFQFNDKKFDTTSLFPFIPITNRDKELCQQAYENHMREVEQNKLLENLKNNLININESDCKSETINQIENK